MIEEIRARHEAAESDGRYDLSWTSYGQAAHRDRTMLLAHVDRLAAELAEIREAAAQVLEDFDNYGLFDGLPLAILIKEKL